MGQRTLTGWVLSTGSEYKKTIPDLESRIRVLKEDSADLSLGSSAGSLSAGEFYFDFDTSILYVRTTGSDTPNDHTMLLKTYYTVFGTWATQAEFTNLEMFQTTSPTDDIYLRYIKVWIMRKNAAIYSGLTLEIHPELSNVPTPKVLYSSENTFGNSDVSAVDNVASEIWFRYNNVPLKASEKYCLVMKATGTFTTGKHLSWLKMDPVYTDSLTLDRNLIAKGPYRYTLIGRKASL